MSRSKRTKAVDISQKVRQEVYARDNLRCISCRSPYNLQVAHIYLSRAKGGLGVKENLAILCIHCHLNYDSGKDKDRVKVERKVYNYMERHYGKPDIEKLKYKKWSDV